MAVITTLRRKSDFTRVFRNGKRAYGSVIKMTGLHHSEPTGPRFAFQLRKRLGSAVLRNRIRRQLKEIAASLKDNINGNWDIIVFVTSNAVGRRYKYLEQEFRQGLYRLGCLPR